MISGFEDLPRPQAQSIDGCFHQPRARRPIGAMEMWTAVLRACVLSLGLEALVVLGSACMYKNHMVEKYASDPFACVSFLLPSSLSLVRLFSYQIFFPQMVVRKPEPAIVESPLPTANTSHAAVAKGLRGLVRLFMALFFFCPYYLSLPSLLLFLLLPSYGCEET